MNSAARADLQDQMTRLAGGDRSAFLPVFNALWPVLRAFVGRQLSAPDSEDVAQEALVRIFVRAVEFDPERDALSWALGIAAFEVRTARKRFTRRREDFVEVPHPVGNADSPEASVIQRNLELAAAEVVGVLRPSDIETLRLLASGERARVRRSAFRKRVERAIKRFRLAWRAKHGTD